MATLPAAAAFTASTVTEGNFRAALTDLREFLATLLGTTGTTAEVRAVLWSLGRFVAVHTSSQTVPVGWAGGLLVGQGTLTYTLPASATAGDGFPLAVRNHGTGVVTVAADWIDGATTLALAPSETVVLVCTGAGYFSVGRQPAVSAVLAGVYTRLTAGAYTATRPAGAVRAHVQIKGGGGAGLAGYTVAGAGGGWVEWYGTVSGDLSGTVGAGGTAGAGGATTCVGAGVSLTAGGGGASGGAGGSGSGGTVIPGTVGYGEVGGAAYGGAGVGAGTSPHPGCGGGVNLPASTGFPGTPGAVFVRWYK